MFTTNESSLENGAARILFVCMGNICRSPAAQAVLREVASRRGLDEAIDIDSAGTTSYHAGEPPDARMIEVSARRGYRLAGRARSLRDDDFERFDLIVVMDEENLRDVKAAAPGDGRAEIRLLSDFLPASGDFPRDVPDPYFGGERGFERVLDMLEAACPGILERLFPSTARS